MSPSEQDAERQDKDSGLPVLTNPLTLPSMESFLERSPKTVYVQYNVARVDPLSIADEPELRGFSRSSSPPTPSNVLALDIDLGASERSSSIVVRSIGEYLEPVQVIYALGDGQSKVFRPRPDNPCLDFDSYDVTDSASPASAHLFGPREYLEALDRELRADQSPAAAARRYFSEMDERSEVRLRGVRIVPAERIQTRNHMGGLLFGLNGRLSQRYRNPKPHAPYGLREEVREDMEYMSRLLLDCAKKHFPDGSGIALGRYEEAYESFANGALRIAVQPWNVWACQPSSGYFFLFGEFALLAAELGIERETWLRLANCMVRCQEIYCTAYAPATVRADRGLWDYKACNFDVRKQFDESAIKQLRKDYAKFTDLPPLSERSVKNAIDLVGAFKP